jgi:ribosomal protein L11 methyltransferase
MPWIELSLRLTRRDWPHVERTLEDLGALAVTLLDAEDQPILEPAAGETPLWDAIVVQALFPAGIDRRGLLAALAELAHGLDLDAATFREVADADWTRAWMDQYQPMRFGERLWVVPGGMALPDEVDPDAVVVVELDPGLAFGSGTHPTTALCLEWLDGLTTDGRLAGRTVLDYGAGSGILAIAALKLGAALAIAVDNDPQALVASRDNAVRNGIDPDRLVVMTPEAFAADPRADGGCQVVVANILAGALVALATLLLRAAAAGAPIALSGVLAEQADEVASAYRPGLAEDAEISRDGDWVRIAGRRLG